MSCSSFEGRTCLVTGGAGFLGQQLVAALIARGAQVRTLDRREMAHPMVDSFVGDLADLDVASRACDGVDIVFHGASVIALHDHAPAQVRRDARRTNVDGTAVLLRAARQAGVTAFVFTSSNHVVLGDEPIYQGDEDLPYAEHARDIYTQTKIAAERLVLEANDGGGLSTCALRPGGLYGPGDPRFVPLAMQLAQILRCSISWGSRSALVDLTHIHNLVYANLLAALRLYAGSPIGGRPFFISDDEPITIAAFDRQLFAALGREVPSVHVPTALVSGLMATWERAWSRLSWPRPPLGQGEVKTVALAHYFSIARARRELDYEPVWNVTRGVRQTVRSLLGGGSRTQDELPLNLPLHPVSSAIRGSRPDSVDLPRRDASPLPLAIAPVVRARVTP